MSKEQLEKNFIHPHPIEKLNSMDKKVIDPLEGVIEGNNRLERYSNFINNVLGKIWPESSQSGEYGNDLYRSTRWAKGDISGYTHSTPFSIDPQFFSPEEFEIAISYLNTPDYLRVRSIPPQLISPDTSIIATGGSCVIETHGMKTITEIQTGIEKGIFKQEYLAETAKRLIDMAPTVTHISGAILGGHNYAVHYIESDMWLERIASYGISKEEADKIVNQAYERISNAVIRRSLLINPEAVIIPVNFDEMPLRKAITEWFKDIKLSYDPKFRIAEVIYTYDGPNQLDLVKKALNEKLSSGNLTYQEKEAVLKMLSASLHSRCKQIDHLRWGTMNLPKEVIIGKRALTLEEEKKCSEDYSYLMGILIMKDVYRVHEMKITKNAAVGLADLPSFNNEVQHQSHSVGFKFRGKPGQSEFIDSVEKHLTHPARLHRNNIEDHLSFLKEYVKDDTARQNLVRELNVLQNLRGKTEAIKEKIIQIRTELKQNNKPTSFPLFDNPFVHHAMQFLWDSDFVVFIKEAVNIQDQRSNKTISKDESNEKIRILMEKIYPKLEVYINYLYDRIDYPHQMRNSRIVFD